ncbi:MAG: hypothetical protein JNN07_14370 [Verrucomicrobiales bacterium]|nr:hypothetical protein [Verrucomicrobiales bacterium]
MSRCIPESIGILPAGALGVGFFYHLTARLTQLDGSVFFVDRPGSSSGLSLRARGELNIEKEGGTQRVPLGGLLKPDLLNCAEQNMLPEVLLACPNPDQLLPILSECVALVEHAHERSELSTTSLPIPLLVLSSNGIYFQRIRQVLIEKLEESTLLGRLPDLWPDLMPLLIGRLMRGVTIQTGIREGDGADAIYRPGPPGSTRIAGGSPEQRRRAHQLLCQRNGDFEIADKASPTRVEFDKALINLSANFLGQLAALDDNGRFRALTIGEVLQRVGEPGILELTRWVVAVGKAVRAYEAHEQPEQIVVPVLESLHAHADHVPSSLQWLASRLARNEVIHAITPTELWLIDPLLHYARSAGLEPAVTYFDGLKTALHHRLGLLASRPRIPN